MHEMVGTAAFNAALPASAIVTNDLTGEELWAMTSLGYAPIKLLMSTSIYSLGRTGGFLAAFKSFHTWRDQRTDAPRSRRLRNRDQSPQGRSRPTGAEDVVGVKTPRDHSGIVSFEPSGAEIQICSPPPCFCAAGASCE
jgi:hypothetical protein